MYYAAVKGTSIDAVLYMGEEFGEKYPEWFQEEILECSHVAENDGTLYLPFFNDDDDGTRYEEDYIFIIPGQTVVMQNRDLDIHTCTIDQFDALYLPVGPHRAALREHCVRYDVYSKDNIKQKYPQTPLGYKNGKFYDWEREHPTNRVIVELENRDGQLRYITAKEFEDGYDTSYPYFPPHTANYR